MRMHAGWYVVEWVIRTIVLSPVVIIYVYLTDHLLHWPVLVVILTGAFALSGWIVMFALASVAAIIHGLVAGEWLASGLMFLAALLLPFGALVVFKAFFRIYSWWYTDS